ncbi:MAG: hypothetical protein KatS3mg095_0545 [Candidatus Parcubacteria bacterium]|nr:MAG: hypothetical protein KatS3mg095_0545 [Candidatus Parcubacteria bacterium]
MTENLNLNYEKREKLVKNGEVYDREQIKSLLPHRDPVLFLDEVMMINKDEAIGHYTIRGNEFGFNEEAVKIFIQPVLLEFFNQCCGVVMVKKISDQ